MRGEIWGRRVSMLPALFGLGLFSIGTATSTNSASVFVTRFLSGLFGSAPVSNVSAALGDIWEPKVRGTAVTFYAAAVVGWLSFIFDIMRWTYTYTVLYLGGPTLGPVIGSALTVSKGLGWRWTE